jgi:ABC-type sugar transport system substrate-binding protein
VIMHLIGSSREAAVAERTSTLHRACPVIPTRPGGTAVYTFRNRKSSKPTRTARGLVAASTAFLTLTLAACGGSSSGSGSDGGSGGASDDAAVSAAQGRLDPYLKPVETIEVDTPLTSKPDPGKKLYSIRYNLPIAAEWDKPLADATAALGWTVTTDAVDANDPQSTSNAMLRAVSQGADFISVNSGNTQVMGPGLDAAKAAGIPVFMAAGVGEVEGEANGVYGNTVADNPMQSVLSMLDQMIVDSGGAGSALLVNAPDFPILTPVNDAAKEHLADNCSGCSLQELNISAADLGGDVASNIVATLRQNPETKYVVTGFDGLVNGLPQALKAAGLNDVQVYIGLPSAPFVQALAKGDYAAGILYSNENRGWLLVDQIARQSLGMDTLQSEHGLLNMQLWKSEDVPDGETSWEPANFQDQYKKLWLVS